MVVYGLPCGTGSCRVVALILWSCWGLVVFEFSLRHGTTWHRALFTSFGSSGYLIAVGGELSNFDWLREGYWFVEIRGSLISRIVILLGCLIEIHLSFAGHHRARETRKWRLTSGFASFRALTTDFTISFLLNICFSSLWSPRLTAGCNLLANREISFVIGVLGRKFSCIAAHSRRLGSLAFLSKNCERGLHA